MSKNEAFSHLTALKHRYDFVILFDVKNGNPNGDPDAGNRLRMDDETGYGLVTDVCLKHKIRQYVETVKEDAKGFRIYIKNGIPLNRSDLEACSSVGIKDSKDIAADLKALKKDDPQLDLKLREYMCSEFFDIRTFGAVMTTFSSLGCAQVQGPVQIGFSRSIDPIQPIQLTITRTAITTEADAEKKQTEFGSKYIVPYALYRCEGHISANFARKNTGFSDDDLQLLWDAIINMFENDHSAARGEMAVRELIVFEHDSELGNAPAHKLFDLIHVEKNPDIDAPRAYSDYTVTINESALPKGVSCSRMV